tara:strand:+ start:1360 stop:1656 length:297 start_codon:yes stop_codon:yes gene_type:complete
MQRPEIDSLDRESRFSQYDRLEGATNLNKQIDDAMPYIEKFSRPARPEPDKPDYGKVDNREIYERWDPETEGEAKEFEARDFLKKYTREKNIHRSQLT